MGGVTLRCRCSQTIQNMKITERQLLILFEIAKGTLPIYGPIGDIMPDDRNRLIDEIINQQGNSLVDVKGDRTEVS
jgi:hypothetical protein